MITRWEEVVEKTAKDMKISYKTVEAEVLRMAQFTQDHLTHPKLMETDLFGIGALAARYGKLRRAIPVLKLRRDYQQRRGDKYLSEGIMDRAAECQAKVDAFNRDIEQFQKFLDDKAVMCTMSRKDYNAKRNKDEFGDDNLPPKHHEKITLKKPRKNGKRRAKRVPGWKPPVPVLTT